MPSSVIGVDAPSALDPSHAANEDTWPSRERSLELATASNARVLGIDQWTGTIKPGYAADLLLVDGRPDEDVRILTDPKRIRYVMVGGREMKNLLGGEGGVGVTA